jgi:arylsulfatase A-like enzyme
MAFALAPLTMSVPARGQGPPPPDRPNVPNLDRLARRGIVFANTLCAALLFSPSRVAVFSGRQPFHTGIYDNHDNILRLARS